MFMKCLTMVP